MPFLYNIAHSIILVKKHRIKYMYLKMFVIKSLQIKLSIKRIALVMYRVVFSSLSCALTSTNNYFGNSCKVSSCATFGRNL